MSSPPPIVAVAGRGRGAASYFQARFADCQTAEFVTKQATNCPAPLTHSPHA